MLTSLKIASNRMMEHCGRREHDNFRARRLTLIIINVNIVEIDFMMNALRRCEMQTQKNSGYTFLFTFWRIEMADKFDWNWQLADHFKMTSKDKLDDDYNIDKKKIRIPS